jgi:2'-5' RNA ligase
MYRLFVSVELPDAVKQQLVAMCAGVPGARWVEPDQLHLTLRFIGEVDGAVFDDVLNALALVEADAFSMSLKGVGHFPPRGDPRVLWAGIEKSEELMALHNKVESVLVRADLPPERRKFHPHVTLARLNHTPVSKVGAFLAHHALFRTPPFPVTSFHLFSSNLTAKHAVHREEASYPLRERLADENLS